MLVYLNLECKHRRPCRVSFLDDCLGFRNQPWTERNLFNQFIVFPSQLTAANLLGGKMPLFLFAGGCYIKAQSCLWGKQSLMSWGTLKAACCQTKCIATVMPGTLSLCTSLSIQKGLNYRVAYILLGRLRMFLAGFFCFIKKSFFLNVLMKLNLPWQL